MDNYWLVVFACENRIYSRILFVPQNLQEYAIDYLFYEAYPPTQGYGLIRIDHVSIDQVNRWIAAGMQEVVAEVFGVAPGGADVAHLRRQAIEEFDGEDDDE